MDFSYYIRTNNIWGTLIKLTELSKNNKEKIIEQHQLLESEISKIDVTSKINKGSFIYVAFISLLFCYIFSVLRLSVLPSFEEIYISNGASFPLFSSLIINSGGFVELIILILLVIYIVLIFIVYFNVKNSVSRLNEIPVIFRFFDLGSGLINSYNYLSLLIYIKILKKADTSLDINTYLETSNIDTSKFKAKINSLKASVKLGCEDIEYLYQEIAMRKSVSNSTKKLLSRIGVIKIAFTISLGLLVALLGLGMYLPIFELGNVVG